jgi:hypothetical protein
MIEADFEKLRLETEQYYSSVEHVRCPALDDALIHFTSEGFNHLRYSKKKARSQVDQAAKFKLVRRGVELLTKTTTIQEYSERYEEIHRKRYKKMTKEWCVVGYWGFIAIIRGVRLKIVVKRIENGKYLFWSAIPVWQTKDFQGHKITDKSKGDLAED